MSTGTRMHDPIVIVGSGASAVHFAQTALELGRQVCMIDVGHPMPAHVAPNASLNELKSTLDDPVSYFLGDRFESFIVPGDDSEYYGFPPGKSYIFADVPGHATATKGFSPLLSFAAGGLSQAWTGGSYPFSDGELAAFPFGWAELAPHYDTIARRIGVSGAEDDLTPFMPVHDALMRPVPLDQHATELLQRYIRRREGLVERHGIYMGHARLATLSSALGSRPGCSQCGRCLWGCPTGSLYTPSLTLALLKTHPGFTYVPAQRVDYFAFDDGQRVTEVVSTDLSSGQQQRMRVGTLVLAAGTIGSARILLNAMHRAGTPVEFDGLMDNRQVLMPFVNLTQIGRGFNDRSYQYHQLALGIPGDTPFDYVHGLITTLNTSLIHPLIHSLPIGSRTALHFFRNLHAALGLVNINFADTRRAGNRVFFDPAGDAGAGRLHIEYAPSDTEQAHVTTMVRRVRRFLSSLGCIAPPNMTRWRPMGASVHYAGTTPMRVAGGDFTTDAMGRCRPFSNLVLADGSTFPSLPAKNLTLTLMANASRIAHGLLSD